MEAIVKEVISSQEVEINKVPFKIDNDKKANWAIKKLKEINNEEERLLNLVDEEISELKFKAQKINKTYENKKLYFKSLLEEYYRENDLDISETKTQYSYKLLDGDIIVKKEKSKLVKKDEKALIDLLDGTEYVYLEKKLNWKDFKKNLEIHENLVINKATGELIDVGVVIEKEPQCFDIKFK